MLNKTRKNEFHVLHKPDVAVKSEASQFTEMETVSQVCFAKMEP